ncbi:GNAT family N-acetyltransferase [Tissierella sp. MB52-C2]|uniref:GNAT family N-acetyltransferase n=1 Tax=Tissierella sp. MB52-C2 TaxID=3070999 RepID=UPI00280B97DF|nr:GNAT family N-acetyltransferase [Tissierella sp. MB52-C2]WMM25507.1 GNAT family N-acetyltransferase [Tissierella sp. MB52-C2]
MYIELDKDEYQIVRNYFNFNFQIPAVAVINGDFPGKIYVDNKENPKGIIVWAISRWAYAYFELESLKRNRAFFKELMIKEITPIIDDLKEQYFEVYSLSDDYDKILEEEIEGFCLYDKHYENTFILNEEKFNKLELKNISGEILERNFPIVPERYKNYFKIIEMNKETQGMILTVEGKIVSQCMNNGFENDNKYFIDLDTFSEKERNKGYASVVAYELIREQRNKGMRPLWETREDNIPSLRVAEKLGFEKIERYPAYIWKKKLRSK